VVEALREPIAITLVVLAAGLLFHYGRRTLERGFHALRDRVPLRLLVFLIVVGLGLLSSLVTAIIASLLLVEAINLLDLDRPVEERLTILTCFSIGLGAALTPIGEPLSTIVTGKLHGDFWLLARLLGPWILPGVLVLGCFAALLHPRQDSDTLKDARPPARGPFGGVDSHRQSLRVRGRPGAARHRAHSVGRPVRLAVARGSAVLGEHDFRDPGQCNAA